MAEVAASLSRGTTGLRPGSPTLPVRTYVGTPALLLPELPPEFARHDARLARLAWLALSPISNASGPRFVVSTACASSAKALAFAQRLLTLGLVDAALAEPEDGGSIRRPLTG